MRYVRHFVLKFVCGIAAMLALPLVGAVADAQTSSAINYKVIADFDVTNGSDPVGNLVIDRSGNIYGVAAHGGSMSPEFCYQYDGCGTVFELSPSASGWTLTLIHAFIGDSATDGAFPVSGLTLDASGNLYGATLYGGSCPASGGCGVVYEISPAAGGGWNAPKILYSFQGDSDGESPECTLTLDKAGNLYGTTISPAPGYGGTVFELSPKSSGEWTHTILYSFNPNDGDGYNPNGGVTFDTEGNLYGSTRGGGTSINGFCASGGCGTVYELSPNGSGDWKETILYSFDGTSGAYPLGNFAVDASGNLYGVTSAGGTSSNCGDIGCGLIYGMKRNAGSGWTEVVLRDLPAAIGGFYSGPALDSVGNLYAGLISGGPGGDGVEFQLKKSASVPWPAVSLHNFTGGQDGGGPAAGPVVYKGKLFGTAGAGGLIGECADGVGCGVVFEISK